MNEKKRLKKIRKRLRDTWFNSISVRLNSKLPKSEMWFHSIYKLHKVYSDKYNEPFRGFIPDIINHEYKYVVEIDGSIHDLPDVKKKDTKKDRKLEGFGYKVFRIRHGDELMARDVIAALHSIRKTSPARILFSKNS